MTTQVPPADTPPQQLPDEGALSLLLNLSPGYGLYLNQAGDIIRSNAAWQQLPAAQKEANLIELLSPALQASWRTFVNTPANDEHFYEFTLSLEGDGEQTRYLTGKVQPVQVADQLGWLCLLEDVSLKIRAERVRDLLYKVARINSRKTSPMAFYRLIHEELQKVLDARNFYIALRGNEPGTIIFPYYTDELMMPQNERQINRSQSNGLTEYAMKQGKAMILSGAELEQLQEEGAFILHAPAAASWMGVPLMVDEECLGLIALKRYQQDKAYTQQDLTLLEFISGQIAQSIERQQREQKLLTQASRLEAIFQNSSLLIWTVDVQGRFTFFNEQFHDTIRNNYQMLPVLGGTYQPLGEKAVDQRFTDFWERKYKLAFKGGMQHFETRLGTRQALQHWREVYITPIAGRQKEVAEISCIALDITESILSKRKLKESEEKFRNIFESFQDIYFRCNLQGNLKLISPSVAEMLGYKATQMLDKDIRDYYLYTSRTKDLLRQLIRHRSVRNFDASIVTHEGDILQCICNVRLIYNRKGRPVEIEGVARDITQLKKTNQALVKQKEIAERSLKVKEQFLANMSHEIRTPMNGIIGVVDLLYTTRLKEEQEGYVSTIKKSSETLLAILNDILDLSKIEAGKMRLRTAPVQLSTVMDKLQALFGQQAHAKKTGFAYTIDPEIPDWLLLDETRLLQVFSNLTSNAIKFTGEGGEVQINLRLSAKAQQELIIEAAVQDSGIGISAKDQKKLFSSFSQVDNSSTKAYEGTGLGLAISKELCKLMGGEIGVSSSQGEGSTFWFTFVTSATAPAPDQQHNRVRANPMGNSALRERAPHILLVDDNGVNRQVASQILLKAGCQVDQAASGAEALNLAAEKTYALIFMDIQMPGMDGVETTQALRALLGAQLAPVVAMTAYSMRDDRERFMSQGMDDYLPKPIQASSLIAKTEAWVLQKEVIPEAAPAPVADQEVIISQEVIDQLAGYGGMEMVLATLSDLEAEILAQIEGIKQDIADQNYKGILSILHTMKGNTGTLGLLQMADRAKKFEAHMKATSYEYIDDDFQSLIAAFESFRSGFKNLKEH